MLFDASIYDNVAMGSVNGTNMPAVKSCLQLANAWEFVKKLPDGIWTTVGQGGRGLSAGQKQRVAIARALIRDAPIMLFDEGASSCDSKPEYVCLACSNIRA